MANSAASPAEKPLMEDKMYCPMHQKPGMLERPEKGKQSMLLLFLLLPTSENKLLTKWHRPYEVAKQVGSDV